MSLSEEEQKVIAKFLEENMKILKPKFSFAKGFTYGIDSELSLDLLKFLSLMDSLVERGFFLKKFFQKAPVCPKCGSQKLLFTSVCPYCGSPNWSKGKVIQHSSQNCNYMGFEHEFVGGVCPHCGSMLKSAKIGEGKETFSLPVDYKVHEVYYKCNSCKKFFASPSISALCLECSTQSTLNDLDWIDLYTYEPTAALQESESTLLLTVKIKSELTSRGYSLEGNKLLGKSGLSHEFDIVASKSETRIALDVFTDSNEKRKDLMLSSYVKAQDIERAKYYFVSTGKLSKEEKKVSETFDINYIEGKIAKEIVDKIEENLALKVKNAEKQDLAN